MLSVTEGWEQQGTAWHVEDFVPLAESWAEMRRAQSVSILTSQREIPAHQDWSSHKAELRYRVHF